MGPGTGLIRHAAARPRRWRRRLLWIGIVLALLAGLFYGGGGWYYSGRLYTLGLSAAHQRAERPSFDVPVLAVTGSSITLGVPASPGEVTKPGVWGAEWPGGYGEVGRILSGQAGSVRRVFRMFTGTPPQPGARAALDDNVYPENPKVGLDLAYRNVEYRGPLGMYPAWFVPGRRTATWAITVHGIDMSRLDCMRIVPTLHAAGLPVLMITYRNDPGAPPAPNGQIGYGSTEWADLQAAVRYALAHGAHRVVLVGYSLGGAIVASFLERSPLAPDVAGTILDSPMLDFSATVDLGASRRRLPVLGLPLPRSLTDVAKWLASIRFGVNWGALDYLPHAGRIHAPVLLFQGAADTTVPPATSAALARELPHLVTYVPASGDVGHLESWNTDPARYDAAVRGFLQRVVG